MAICIIQPNQTATLGTRKASHSAAISPMQQPLPQWEAPLATMTRRIQPIDADDSGTKKSQCKEENR